MFLRKQNRLHLDYETFSECDLKKCGAYKYAQHASTEILMLGWALDDEPVSLWEPHKGHMPPRLKDAMLDRSLNRHAYNAQFERLITKHCLGLDIPAEAWRCTMVESYYLGFAGTMNNVLKAIGLPLKDDRGSRLINLFSSPAPKNHKADRYTWGSRPKEWHEFGQYCIQDVEVERALWHWLQRYPKMPQWDFAQWCIDQDINDRGVPMDVPMAVSAISIWEQEKERIVDKMQKLTGLNKVTRVPFLEWLNDEFELQIDSLSKDNITSLMAREALPPDAKIYLDLWSQKEAKATTKYHAVVNGTGADGRARGMFQYKGASRTDRVGGRLIQLQNLKRPLYGGTEQSIENVVNAIKTDSPDMISMLYKDNVSDVLGGSIRHALCASEGKKFVVCDLTSIESVILGWVAMCPTIDDTFRQGRDSYKTFASNFYGIPYDEVTKAQRSFSKPPVLGCGFMLGWKGLIAYAEGYGVKMDEKDARNAVDTFRKMYPEIVKFWDWIYAAVKHTVITGIPNKGYRMHIERDDDFLRIWLPSGRALSYFKPEIRKQKAPWSTPEKIAYVDNFTYMGNDDAYRWVRLSAHAGGVTENIVQSLAGDILWNGIVNATNAGLPVVLHVHDEIAVEVDEQDANAALPVLQKCMTKQPQWCTDMWLGAEGFITKRYTKD